VVQGRERQQKRYGIPWGNVLVADERLSAFRDIPRKRRPGPETVSEDEARGLARKATTKSIVIELRDRRFRVDMDSYCGQE
jgi:hypothetical protein